MNEKLGPLDILSNPNERLSRLQKLVYIGVPAVAIGATVAIGVVGGHETAQSPANTPEVVRTCDLPYGAPCEK